MFVNIEQEYKNYVFDVWQNQQLDHQDVSGLRQEHEERYSSVSDGMIQFLQAKLDSLETASE